MAEYKGSGLVWFLIFLFLAPFILFLILLWLLFCPRNVSAGEGS